MQHPSMFGIVSALAAASAAGPVLAQARLFEAPLACNRACLLETANDYLAALVAHDPRPRSRCRSRIPSRARSDSSA
jgi:hypothetical protein